MDSTSREAANVLQEETKRSDEFTRGDDIVLSKRCV